MAIRKSTTATPNTEKASSSRSKDEPTRSKADLFNKVKPGASGVFPAGKHEMRIIEAELQVKDDDSESVMFKYEGTEGDVEGKTVCQWYGILTAPNDNGEVEAGKGVGFLRRDLEILGFEESDTEYDNLEATLEALVEKAPLVATNVKLNGQYTNVYIQKLIEE
jgi:hypothetical protein